MLGKSEVRRSVGARGQARAIERFSTDDCARVHLEVYDYVLRNRRPGPTPNGAAQ